MSTLHLKNLNKIYPNGVQAVFDFNLKIEDKEFIVLVGPSGCGKSTTLRMVAGLEEITSGELYIDDELVNDKAPKDRNIAMVFQSYALYPHMTVYENMAFGLKLRKMPKLEIEEKVREAAEILGLVPYLDRKPKALSGGQRQRVALGRAIVRNAKVFLMDEPLSNLDAKLRVQMRGELIKLHNNIETTTIYVTHDQIEAMTMADRIVVMKDGFIQQVAPPKEIYDNPINVFVAGFIGTPPMNFIRGVVDEKGIFTIDGQKIRVPEDKMKILRDFHRVGKEIILGIRPEDIHDDAVVFEAYPESIIEVTVDVAELLGAETNVYMTLNDSSVCASIDARAGVQIGDKMRLALDMNKVHFFDLETEVRLRYEDGKPVPFEKVLQQTGDIRADFRTDDEIAADKEESKNKKAKKEEPKEEKKSKKDEPKEVKKDKKKNK